MAAELQNNAVAAPLAASAPAVDRAFEAPEQEAAFFYGLFLRGYTYQELRHDIDVPPAVLAKWERQGARDPQFAAVTQRMVGYRRRVLAIFQALVAAKTAPVQ